MTHKHHFPIQNPKVPQSLMSRRLVVWSQQLPGLSACLIRMPGAKKGRNLILL